MTTSNENKNLGYTKGKINSASDFDKYQSQVLNMIVLRWIAVVGFLIIVQILALLPLFYDLNEKIFVYYFGIFVSIGIIVIIIVISIPLFKKQKSPFVPDDFALSGHRKEDVDLPRVYHRSIPLKSLAYIMIPCTIFLGLVFAFVPDITARVILLITILILILCYLVLGKLDVDCTPGTLWFHWGPFGKKIPLNDILTIRSISIHPMRDFMGWGFRLGADGSIGYISSGKVGVRLALKNGKEYVATVPDPQLLVDYVKEHRG